MRRFPEAWVSEASILAFCFPSVPHFIALSVMLHFLITSCLLASIYSNIPSYLYWTYVFYGHLYEAGFARPYRCVEPWVGSIAGELFPGIILVVWLNTPRSFQDFPVEIAPATFLLACSSHWDCPQYFLNTLQNILGTCCSWCQLVCGVSGFWISLNVILTCRWAQWTVFVLEDGSPGS